LWSLQGASSGLGRAAAIRFAEQGAVVVLAARREDALQETARLCRLAGGVALSVVTDVTREADMAKLLECALSHSGRIDVWINNAGVTLFGLLEDAPFAEHQRVIETNLYGPMLAARAVIPVFRRQQRGTLINVGSILSKIGQPFVPSYVISKFALRGLSEALRADLAGLPDVHICTLMPYAIDTPHFQDGANHVGRTTYAMPPVQSPEKVADIMLQLAVNPRRERHVPRAALLGYALHYLFPRSVERVLADALSKWHFDAVPRPTGPGHLFLPSIDRALVLGKRRPRVGAPTLVAWAAFRLLTVQAEFATKRLQRWVSRTTRIARALASSSVVIRALPPSPRAR
jgi:NAD(P)-dependent dehydrogenase (short-subunit alcohol dehydrogenase family)